MDQLVMPGFERITQFTIEGVTYSSQFRRCGKDNCKCASGDPGDFHGPYWYRRDQLGNVGYVGKTLPAAVVVAWANFQSQKPFLDQKITDLYEDLHTLEAQIEALRLLRVGGFLNSKQRIWVEASGFFDCLVSDATGSEILIQDGGDNGRGLW